MPAPPGRITRPRSRPISRCIASACWPEGLPRRGCWRSLWAAVDRPSLFRFVMGGIVYSIGAGIHGWRRLPFHDAIWHALVLIAAGCHYAAILYGVVLLAPRS